MVTKETSDQEGRELSQGTSSDGSAGNRAELPRKVSWDNSSFLTKFVELLHSRSDWWTAADLSIVDGPYTHYPINRYSCIWQSKLGSSELPHRKLLVCQANCEEVALAKIAYTKIAYIS